MDFIDNILKKYLKLIDSGKFFRNVVKPAYLIIGWLHLLLPLFVIVTAVRAFSDDYGYHKLGKMLNAFGEYKVVLALVLLILLAAACLAAYLAIKFWRDRAQRLDVLLNNQSEFCVLPILVTFIRNKGEGQGMVFTIAGLGISIAFGLGALITSFIETDYFSQIFMTALGFLIVGSIISIVGGYLIVLIHRFISESLGLMVSVAGNVSKIAHKN